MLILRTWTAKLLIIVLPAAGILGLLLLYGGFRYSETPEFCITCHYKQPYYDTWKKSAHNEVNCVKCHFEPGIKAHIKGKIRGFVQLLQYIFHFYGPKPSADISDAVCLQPGCHQKQDIKDGVMYKEKVKFGHTTHLGDLKDVGKLRCTTCHSQIVLDEHITVEKFVCFTCHFKDVKPGTGTADCRICHTPPESHKEYLEEDAGDSSEACLMCHSGVIEGKGNVHKMRCYSCHADRADIARYDEKGFIHRSHVSEHKVECFECHDEIKHPVD